MLKKCSKVTLLPLAFSTKNFGIGYQNKSPWNIRRRSLNNLSKATYLSEVDGNTGESTNKTSNFKRSNNVIVSQKIIF
jgi:hypothetical protein